MNREIELQALAHRLHTPLRLLHVSSETVSQVREDFNGFIDLPLVQDVRATGYIFCPIGMAVTSTRIWVAHLDFIDLKRSTDKLWPHYSLFEDEPPFYKLAFARESLRAEGLATAIQLKTKAPIICPGVLFDDASGKFSLTLHQEQHELHVSIYEDNGEIHFDDTIYLPTT